MIQMRFGTDRENSHGERRKIHPNAAPPAREPNIIWHQPSFQKYLSKKKRIGNYWLLFIHSCLRPAACPGWLWLLRASIEDLSTLGGVVAWVYVGQTDFECLVFPSDIIFFWSFCFSPFLHLSLTPLLLLHLASSVCLPNPLKCSLS